MSNETEAEIIDKSDWILMPPSLTAENGSKAAFMSRFYVGVYTDCAECEGSGYDDDSEDGECELCEGSGTIASAKTVPWATIQEIYAAAVKTHASRADVDTDAEIDYRHRRAAAENGA